MKAQPECKAADTWICEWSDCPVHGDGEPSSDNPRTSDAQHLADLIAIVRAEERERCSVVNDALSERMLIVSFLRRQANAYEEVKCLEQHDALQEMAEAIELGEHHEPADEKGSGGTP